MYTSNVFSIKARNPQFKVGQNLFYLMMKFKINKSIPEMLLRSHSIYNVSLSPSIKGFTHRISRAAQCTQIKRDYLIEVIPLKVMNV